jgi:hypothetical protein
MRRQRVIMVDTGKMVMGKMRLSYLRLVGMDDDGWVFSPAIRRQLWHGENTRTAEEV